jgi:hypothetical protein
MAFIKFNSSEVSIACERAHAALKETSNANRQTRDARFDAVMEPYQPRNIWEKFQKNILQIEITEEFAAIVRFETQELKVATSILNKMDKIEQIHKLCEANRIVYLSDEDFALISEHYN